MAVWILRGSGKNNAMGVHIACWFSVLMQLVCRPRSGKHINTSKFLQISVEFTPFWTYIQNSDKGNASL